MSALFLYTSYDIAWLGEKVHSFMTKRLIAIPFKPASYGEGQDYLKQGKEFWTAQTRVFQTELTCTTAEIEAFERTMYGFSMDKCGYTINPVGYTPGSSFSKFSGTRNMIYIGLANAADAGYHLSEKVCKAPNLFLAI